MQWGKKHNTSLQNTVKWRHKAAENEWKWKHPGTVQTPQNSSVNHISSLAISKFSLQMYIGSKYWSSDPRLPTIRIIFGPEKKITSINKIHNQYIKLREKANNRWKPPPQKNSTPNAIQYLRPAGSSLRFLKYHKNIYQSRLVTSCKAAEV